MGTLRDVDVLHRARGVLWRRCLDGTLIWTPTADEPRMLPSPGDVVWELLGEPATRRDVLERVVGAFPEADPEIVRAETTAFLDELYHSGAVVTR